MNIGIDIDGVLIDLEKFMRNYGSKYSIEEGIPLHLKEIYYSEEKTFNWTVEQAEKFWNRYLVQYIVQSEPIEFASEIIKKLKQEGNKIYIITARNESGLPPESYGKMQQLTKEWLNKNDIKYDKLIFTTDENKIHQCIENKIDMMIEDYPRNILEISSKIPVIKYEWQYNKEVENDNVITAYSWYQIYDIINKKMKGEKIWQKY